ncbi:hypothetical protein [Sulfobacillus harzensis]|uniref:Uncharacterized protein n=1 Tax=Sulfobacillus harzensis TaxID=2729629 RepID=A0A7Y0L343_9FIRM|nr:hypothetical protein [Sulfobacillus harzensis]NMP22300.1 hypothetical protein [Sulfobacillus harzensis]
MSDWHTLRAPLATLTRPVHIRLRTQDRTQPMARAAWELVTSLIDGLDHLTVSIEPGSERLVVSVEAGGSIDPITFWGVPSGFELEGLVEVLVAAGRGQSRDSLSPETRGLIETIHESRQHDLYVAPT